MRIPLSYNGLDLTGDRLFIERDPSAKRPRVERSARIGVDYAQHWKDAPLRFFDPRSRAVSKVRASPAAIE
jgi:DNA-3-methyladenine glycosylase